MYKKLSVKDFYKGGLEQFRDYYESDECQDFLDYVESRMRLEILQVVRGYGLKGEVFFELRKKRAISAFDKIATEIEANMDKFSNEHVHIHDIIMDVIGCRLICNDAEVVEKIVASILTIENIEISREGIEFYDAPFRRYIGSEDRFPGLNRIITNHIRETMDTESSSSDIGYAKRQSKESNYESLHFYANFSSPFDHYHHLPTTLDDIPIEPSQERRDKTEWAHIKQVWGRLSPESRLLTTKFPVEFQVRTITEHLWASEEHKYVYSKIKQKTLNTSKEEFGVLKNSFVALKYAFHHVDNLRSMVKGIAIKPAKSKVVYAGTSKDLHVDRLPYFSNQKSLVVKLMQLIGNDFEEARGSISLSESKRAEKLSKICDDLLKAHNLLLVENDTETLLPTVDFSIEPWGRTRVFLLLLAYILLFSSVGERKESNKLSREANELLLLLEKLNLQGIPDLNLSLKYKSNTVQLSSTLYSYIRAHDQFAVRRMEVAGDRDSSSIFYDPLVGVRLASSLFMLEEFIGAHNALESVLALPHRAGLESWKDLKLASDFSLMEIHLRNLQYIWFEYFDDYGELLNRFHLIEKEVTKIFDIDVHGFDLDAYRAYSFYQVIYTYIRTKQATLPKNFLVHKNISKAYLKRHRDEVFKDLESYKSAKIEILMAGVGMNSKNYSDDSYSECLIQYREVSKGFSAYPGKAVNVLNQMINEIDNKRQSSARMHSDFYGFISYSWSDRDLAKSVAEELGKIGLKVRYDKDIGYGESVTTQIEKMMQEASWALILLTENYLTGGNWIKPERAALLGRNRNQDILLLVGNEGVTQESILKNVSLLADLNSIPLSGTSIKTFAKKVSKAVKEYESQVG